mmetsp:Transcript_30989/g.72146  ORF Transcript_30989/g.72146 Transcript_30989/m.72146 type:complete len:214 (-) Transcript_30989:225-866(-)
MMMDLKSGGQQKGGPRRRTRPPVARFPAHFHSRPAVRRRVATQNEAEGLVRTHGRATSRFSVRMASAARPAVRTGQSSAASRGASPRANRSRCPPQTRADSPPPLLCAHPRPPAVNPRFPLRPRLRARIGRQAPGSTLRASRHASQLRMCAWGSARLGVRAVRSPRADAARAQAIVAAAAGGGGRRWVARRRRTRRPSPPLARARATSGRRAS